MLKVLYVVQVCVASEFVVSFHIVLALFCNLFSVLCCVAFSDNVEVLCVCSILCCEWAVLLHLVARLSLSLTVPAF